MKSKTISIIGLGYIGLPTAALLANLKYNVTGIDIKPKTIKTVNQGKSHILEPDLANFVRSAITSGFLKTSITPIASDIYIICVPTPCNNKDKIPKPDISSVIAAVKNIAPLVKSGDLIILESTSPVGTTEKLQNIFKEAHVPVDEIHLAYCPERVLPGRIMKELVENDRIIGGMNAKSTKLVADFYRTFVQGTVFETNVRTAELCKLTENSFRDVNIAFANELSLLCEKEEIDIWELINLANRHPRVNILHPGPGVGGHCIAVDPWFIVSKDPENAKIIRAAREINNYKTNWVIEKIKVTVADIVVKTGKKPKIACFGLTFKANVDDLRESPALKITKSLFLSGYDVVAVEPNIQIYDKLNLVELEDAMNSAEIFALLVKHKQFLVPEIRAKLGKKIALDFCGILI